MTSKQQAILFAVVAVVVGLALLVFVGWVAASIFAAIGGLASGQALKAHEKTLRQQANRDELIESDKRTALAVVAKEVAVTKRRQAQRKAADEKTTAQVVNGANTKDALDRVLDKEINEHARYLDGEDT